MATNMTFLQQSRVKTLSVASELTKIATRLEKRKRGEDVESIQRAAQLCYIALELACENQNLLEKKLSQLIGLTVSRIRSTNVPRKTENSILSMSKTRKTKKKPSGPTPRRRSVSQK